MEREDQTNDSILRRVKAKAGEMQADALEKVAAISGAGAEEFRARIADMDEVIPIIAELGYTLQGVRIGIGLIPDIGLTISGLTKTMPEDRYNRVLEEHKDKPLLIGVVKSLQAASALQQKIHMIGMRADTASITLSVPPKVSLEFRREG